MTIEQINNLDSSYKSFELIKSQSELFWEETNNEFNRNYIQKDTKWNEGLSEFELIDFQNQLGIKFPESLQNYYRVMNGLNLPGVYINEGEIEYKSVFYSYPNDIELIKSIIQSTLKTFEVKENQVPFIFPYYGNRYLIFNEQENVLSIMNDVIYWSDNLCKAIAQDIFARKIDFRELELSKLYKTDFWTLKVENEMYET